MRRETRRFCFLQGPHGPFFRELAEALGHLGHETFRIGFNQGDEREWGDPDTYVPFRGDLEAWREQAVEILGARGVTDIALYGDGRAYHQIAVQAARSLGARTHYFEEGYLRPFWITYERYGVNGSSPLMALELSDIAEDRLPDDPADEIPPARWGELNAHVVHSLKYHIGNHFLNGRYPKFHRHLPQKPVEDWLYTAGRVLKIPTLRRRRMARERALEAAGRPYHLVLLQLRWDASIQRYSRFTSVGEVIEESIAAFAAGAPEDHAIVFKTHPLEDGRERLDRCAFEAADRHGVDRDRVVFLDGGPLAKIVEPARSVVTVNSTAAHQALWRNIPVKALGAAIFAKPGLISQKPLEAFFAAPDAPDPRLYQRFRRLLLATSQIKGGYYTGAGRGLALGPAVRSMLATGDPYAPFLADNESLVAAQ